MPRGRFISKEISLDEKVNALSDDTARLLFTWLISHLDCEGRLHGDAITVKSIVFPRRPIRTTKIEKYLVEFEEKGLIVRYSCDGNAYLAAPSFEKHQVGLQKSKEAQSQIPPPTPDLLQSNSKISPPQVEVEEEVKVKAKAKEEVVVVNNNIIEELQSLSQWGATHSLEDAQWLVEFLAEYPQLTDSHIKACRDFHSNKTKHNKALWKTRLRNWMKKDREFQKGGRHGRPEVRGADTHQRGTEELGQWKNIESGGEEDDGDQT